jgi:hypothetical protein
VVARHPVDLAIVEPRREGRAHPGRAGAGHGRLTR